VSFHQSGDFHRDAVKDRRLLRCVRRVRYSLLLSFDGLPIAQHLSRRISVRTAKDMRMPADHFCVNCIGDVVNGEVATFAGNLAVKDYLKKQVAEFITQIRRAALKLTNRKFRQRFSHIEDRLQARDRSFESTTLEELESLWQEAKTNKQ
jgi:hypothetical protein